MIVQFAYKTRLHRVYFLLGKAKAIFDRFKVLKVKFIIFLNVKINIDSTCFGIVFYIRISILYAILFPIQFV